MVAIASSLCQLVTPCWIGASGLSVFLYFGPETFVPLASFVASVVGLLLMFWRYVVSRVRKSLRFLSRGGFAEKEVHHEPEHPSV